MEFDEQKAIEFIKQRLSEANRTNYDDDEILNVIDIIFDYYEDNDMLDIDLDDDDDEESTNQLIQHVVKMLTKDPYTQIVAEDVDCIVRAELEYEQSIVF